VVDLIVKYVIEVIVETRDKELLKVPLFSKRDLG